MRQHSTIAARLQAFFTPLAFLRERQAIILLALLFLAFLALSLLIRQPALKAYDEVVTLAWQSHRHRSLDSLALAFTFLGNGRTLVVLGALTAAYFLLTRRRRTALVCLLALLGHPLTLALKEIVGRERPQGGGVQVLLPAVGLSFPSGHALGSTLFYGFLALLCYVLITRVMLRIALTLLCIGLAAGIGLSRVYLGAHWLSDVIGGWTGGLFFLLLLAELYKKIATSELAPTKHEAISATQTEAETSDIAGRNVP